MKRYDVVGFTNTMSSRRHSIASSDMSLRSALSDITPTGIVDHAGEGVGLSNAKYSARRRKMLDLVNRLRNIGY